MPFQTEYGMSGQERADNLRCRREHRASWVVVMRRANRSAFNGYHWTPSDYSALRCLACGRFWRTKAEYVDTVRDARRDEAYR